LKPIFDGAQAAGFTTSHRTATSWRALAAFAFFLFHPILRLQAQTSDILINRSFPVIPQWQNRYFLGFELEPPPSPTIFAYDIKGEKVFETQLAIDGAFQVGIWSLAASRDGRFAVSGLAINLNTRTPFIAFLDRTGRITRLIRPDHWYAHHICFTSDGNLWVAGTAGRATPKGPEPEHDVLRVYTPDGSVKATFLPRVSFAPDSRDIAMYPAPAGDAGQPVNQLAANDSSVVFLTVGYQQMVGLSLDGKVLFRTKVDLLDRGGSPTGFAVAPDGRVYLSSQEEVSGDSRTLAFVFYQFDPASGKWSTIYRRTNKERGLPMGVSLFDQERMLVHFQPGRYAWLQPAGGSYPLGK
jgi:hypothetical protein